MRVTPNVYFRKFGDQCYVRHVGLAKDFLMNEISFDILDFIHSHEGCTLSELCDYLKEQYEITDETDFESEIEEFISQLTQDELLISDNADPKEDEELIRNYIQQKCFENHWLCSACLELTYRCNEKCIHCYADTPPDQREELTTAEYRDIVKQLKNLGCLGVLLTGGEVTLRSDFFEIAECVKENGMLVDVYTNGLNLSDSFIDRLIELKPNSVSFSLYGGTPEIHDRVTTVPGSFEKSLKSLMTIKCSGIDTYIKTVVMKQNVDDYENLLRLGKRLQIPINTSISVMPSHGGKSAEPYRLLDTQKYLEILKLQKKYEVSNFNRKVSNRGDYICASGLDAWSIDPFGDVHPCNAHPMSLGNIRDVRLKDIWENSEQLESLRSIRPADLSEKCADCEDFNWCTVCIGSAVRENNKLAPCSDTCMIANAYHCMYKKM